MRIQSRVAPTGRRFATSVSVLLVAFFGRVGFAEPAKAPQDLARLTTSPHDVAVLSLDDSLQSTASRSGVGLHYTRAEGSLVLGLWACGKKCTSGTPQVEIVVPNEAAILRPRVQKIELEQGGRALWIRFGGDANHYTVLVVGAPSRGENKEVAPQVLLKGWSGLASQSGTKIRLQKRNN